jgi:hypothetical protein
MTEDLGYKPGPMGWVVPGASSEQEMLDAEKRYLEKAFEDYPLAYQSRPAREMLPAIKVKWEAFQQERGRFPGSQDLTLIDEFVFGKSYTWLSQKIGSCVWSNTFRRWFERMCVEICLYGELEEFIGSTQYGPQSIAPFCINYGFARQRANMKGGDGLYCKPMAESLVKDGIVFCSNSKLRELMTAAGAIRDTDYPEPQSERLYRRIGDWAWNNELRPHTSCRLLESPSVNNIQLHNANVLALKPMFQCSGIAIRRIGQHRDGFGIHARDPNNSWAHNMGWAGVRVASDGERYHRLCNTSWLPDNSTNAERYIYNIPEKEVENWYQRGRVDVSTIGDIDGVDSLPYIMKS